MIKPLGDYVLLEKKEAEKKVGSIILTSDKKKNGNVGTVVSTGPGARNEKGELTPMSVKAGDEVIYRDYSGTDYEDGEKKYLLIKVEDIIAIIE